MDRPSTETRRRKRNRINQGATVSRQVTQLLTRLKLWVPLLALHKPVVVTPVVETEASDSVASPQQLSLLPGQLKTEWPVVS